MRSINIILPLVLLLVGGCSSGKKTDPDKAAEVPNKEIVQTDLSQNELFRRSKELYENALFSTAAESFQALRDSYSPGPYTEFAEIKLADSHFEMRKFEAAAAAYEDFLKNHPNSVSAPYALLRAGRSYELSNRGVGRDVAPLEKAKDYYEQLIAKYPDSVYASAARQYFQSVAKKLADHAEFVLDFYERKENEAAVEKRKIEYAASIEPLLKRAEEQTAIEKEVSERAALESSPAPEVLEVQRAAFATESPKAAPKTEKIKSEVQIAAPATYRIQSVQCIEDSGRKIFIYLNKEFNDRQFLENHAVVSPADTFQLTLPDASSKLLDIDCFGDNDLTVSKAGSITLNTTARAALIPLSNPPRLLLSFE